MPSPAKAGILSSFLGNNVSASTNMPDLTDKNSQNMGLLQANVSSALIIQDKKDKKDKKDDKVDQSKDVNIVSDNSLLPAVSPVSALGGVDEGDFFTETSVYVVRKDDSVAQIAEMFDVSVNTILWANNLKKGEKLKEGDVLLISPVTGVIHVVAKGETLKGIAAKFKADIGDIAGFNGISEDSSLVVGDELIIPDGTIMGEEGASKSTKSNNSSKKYYDTHNLPTIVGYFMNPMPGARLTQGLHDRGGIDLAAPKGTPVRASASGTVIFARNGYNGGYGNLVIISHSNGTTTLYGHLSAINVNVGEHVAQGEQIGAEGSTGRSTGPHLHFKITNAINPGAFLQVGSNLNANWK